MTPGEGPGLFRKVDCVQVPVPDLAAGIAFYRDRLGQELKWRTETAAGLRLGDTELVLQTERPQPEVDLLVDSVPGAVDRIVDAGGAVVVRPFDVPVGQVAVVNDPFGNRLVIIDLSKGAYLTDGDGRVIGQSPTCDLSDPVVMRKSPPDQLTSWCPTHLGSDAIEVLWEKGHLSSVVAVRLADGREVVVKTRPWTPSLPACHAVHAHLWSLGFPCPEPITGPDRIGDLAVSAEVHLPGGRSRRGDDPTLAEDTAAALFRLISMAPAVDDVATLDPPRPWVGWPDHRARPWPPPDEGPALNADTAGTGELRPLAEALNQRLRATPLPLVVGHGDWYQGNLRWADACDILLAADDWDSITALPEAALAGCAAASFRPGLPGVHPDDWPGAEIDDSAHFLDAYARARGRPFDDEEAEIAWAAGLWQRVFDAAKALAVDRPEAAAAQIRDAEARARLAGL